MTSARRTFLINGGLAATALAGCQASDSTGNTSTVEKQQRFRWKMATTWPRDFPGAGTGAQRLADTIRVMSDDRLDITVYGAGELIPAFEVFDATSSGTVEMGHGAAYYWKGKAPEAQYFANLPFGMTAEECNAWLYYGGGLDLWRELYEPFDLEPFPAGNTGVQMAGWYGKAINTIDDLKGLKIRMPGIGGEILRRAGAIPQTLPGAEIFTALSTGTIDATEWIGPWNDLALGLHQAADNYYYPGWHEPGSVLECMVNRTAYMQLPDDLKAIVKTACAAANQDILSEYNARNQQALDTLIKEHEVNAQPLPSQVLNQLRQIADEVITELANTSELAQRINTSYFDFYNSVRQWTERSTGIYLQTR